MIKFNQTQLFTFLCFFFILFSPLVRGGCTCEPEDEDRNKPLALKYKMAAIVSILVAGAIGVCFPLLGKTIDALRPEKDIFFVIKAFAAGVILSTGFIHVLPDATENLTSPCLNENPWGKFPFAGLVAMVSATATLLVDTFVTSHYTKPHLNNTQQGHGDEEKKTKENEIDVVHVHAHASSISVSTQLLRYRVVSQVLELGIVVHSVIIGISLGASESPKTIKPLVAALTFHQFFEGMGLGGCILQAKLKARSVAIMVPFFALTTPVGIGIGIGISNTYNENSPTALVVEGMLNAASAGILIYMALVDLLAADFMNPKLQNNGKVGASAGVSLLLGSALMSLLAVWA
ncbi:zinc transporter 3-like [Gossypium arboreum]|uniref:Uncharacterized protein n=1 Tax=Gossypium arboreum TaxID=29729 RepID=A0ABR0NXC5_GOSAR|nr:zinc transporter 3-like [Gossypium arboreum]KAK5810991.1 hypothetical protein PVK06_026308 [Gossypium arboreum]